MVVALCCALAAPARAQLATVAAPEAPVRVWYRSSEGCPDGVSFVDRLGKLGRPAALAGVGDRVDFVVTLAARADASAGRLERQTERGTVAIREVESPACADVAEALALSLELALEPGVARDPRAVVALPPTAELPLAQSAAGAASVATRALPRDRAERAEPAPAPQTRLGWGAQGRLAVGLGPDVLPGAALFAELSPVAGPSSVRFAVHGAYGQSEERGSSVSVLLLAGEVDACAWRWRAEALSLEPCLGLDLGRLQASSAGARGSEDRGLWASTRVLLRSRLELWPELWPELQLGLLVPFTRYVFGAPEGDDLFRVRAVAAELSVGARWAP